MLPAPQAFIMLLVIHNTSHSIIIYGAVKKMNEGGGRKKALIMNNVCSGVLEYTVQNI